MNITTRNITYYKSKGYDIRIGDKVEIDVNDISKSSHYKITAICTCGTEIKIMYHKYVINVSRCGFYGCKKCSNEKREITNTERFGVDNYMKTEEGKEKVAQSNIKNYGVKTTLLEKKTKEKIRKTIQDKYGVDEILSSKEIIEKSKKTLFERFGVDHYSKTIDFYNKTYNSWKREALEKLEKYEIKDFILKEDRTIDIKCDCGLDHYYNINTKNLYQRKEIQNNILCTICNSVISQKQSGKELQVLNFIKENYEGEIIENDKNIVSELDIYLPELKIGFEFNGIYWHSDLYKNKKYHFNKTEDCEKKNVHLIHIFEDDWIFRQKIVKSMILNKLDKNSNKIYARKCLIKEINDNDLVRNFLNENHIQGFVGSSIKLGLFYNDTLVSLMTFGKTRKNLGTKSQPNIYELLRFCNILNSNVIGGASRLFKHFVDNYQPKEILTYADRCWSQGKLYHELKFDLISKTEPNYSYYDMKCNKFNRFNFRKDVLIKKGYDPKKTEFEIMDELGYLRVFNSGNLKFLFKPNLN